MGREFGEGGEEEEVIQEGTAPERGNAQLRGSHSRVSRPQKPPWPAAHARGTRTARVLGQMGGVEEEGWGAQPVGPEQSRAELSGGHRREEHT